MLAALHMASVAAMVAIKPLVSISPRASPLPLRPAVFAFAIANSSRKDEYTRTELHADRGRFLARQGQDAAQIFVRPGDDLDADDLADAGGRRAAGVDGGLDRRHVADHQRRHHAAADLLP